MGIGSRQGWVVCAIRATPSVAILSLVVSSGGQLRRQGEILLPGVLLSQEYAKGELGYWAGFWKKTSV